MSCATTVVAYVCQFLLIEHGTQYLAESWCSASDLDSNGMPSRISRAQFGCPKTRGNGRKGVALVVTPYLEGAKLTRK